MNKGSQRAPFFYVFTETNYNELEQIIFTNYSKPLHGFARVCV